MPFVALWGSLTVKNDTKGAYEQEFVGKKIEFTNIKIKKPVFLRVKTDIPLREASWGALNEQKEFILNNVKWGCSIGPQEVDLLPRQLSFRKDFEKKISPETDFHMLSKTLSSLD